jgi:hypothetical protein
MSDALSWILSLPLLPWKRGRKGCFASLTLFLRLCCVHVRLLCPRCPRVEHKALPARTPFDGLRTGQGEAFCHPVLWLLFTVS